MTAHSSKRQHMKRMSNVFRNEKNLSNQVTDRNELSRTSDKNEIGNRIFQNSDGNGEVFLNFDKKKFVKNINGMTKFFIALGVLDSRFDNDQISDQETILHYIHIPLNLLQDERLHALTKIENKESQRISF